MNEKDAIKERLSYFPKLYDVIQIFGPMSKETLLEKKGACLLEEECVKKNACENCVAIRSLMENKTISKYEEFQGKGMSMTATPVRENGKDYVVELFRELNQDDLKYMGVIQDDVLKQIDALNYELMHDSLTGAFNRRFMEERLGFGVLDALHKKKIVTIAMADIDLFKKVNDTYGHQAGDEVLRVFSSILQKNLDPAGALVVRYGGEEFLIYLPDTEEAAAKKLLEQVRCEFEKEELSFEGNTIRATASFGVITAKQMKETEVSCADRLVQLADLNLYQAKNQGRNCVVSGSYVEEESENE